MSVTIVIVAQAENDFNPTIGAHKAGVHFRFSPVAI